MSIIRMNDNQQVRAGSRQFGTGREEYARLSNTAQFLESDISYRNSAWVCGGGWELVVGIGMAAARECELVRGAAAVGAGEETPGLGRRERYSRCETTVCYVSICSGRGDGVIEAMGSDGGRFTMTRGVFVVRGGRMRGEGSGAVRGGLERGGRCTFKLIVFKMVRWNDLGVGRGLEVLHLMKILGLLYNTKDTIRFNLDTQEITYTVDMFRATLQLLMETLENPFVAPVNIDIIESFMHMVGYQGVVDKKFTSIPPRFEEDYHSIKDDIPLVVKREKDVESYADKFAASMIYDDVDDFGDRIEPESHKEYPKVVVDDDDNKEEKKDEKEVDEMGKLTDNVSLSTPTTSKDPHKQRRISSKYSHLPVHGKFDQVLHEIVPQLAEKATDELIESNLKPIIVDTII
ncbi:hypothetical protein Tco_0228718 [Tanacetum coccineum]